MFRGTWIAFCLLILFVPASWALAADSKQDRAIATYLETNWQPAAATKVDAEAKFAELQNVVKGDVRLYYAHTLVCIQQRRFDDAAKAADELLAIDDAHLPAWQAKVWLALLNKHYGAALAAAEKMGEVTAKTRNEADRERTAEAARFLGMAFGFLEGPVGESPATITHKEVEKKVVEGLNPEQLKLFKDARQTVMEKYITYVSNKEESKEKAIADEEAEKQRKMEEVGKRRQDIVGEIEADRKQHKELESKYQQQAAEISKADSPLAAELIRVETTGNSILQQLNMVQGQLANVDTSLSREKDPTARAILQSERNCLANQANRFNNDLFAVQQAVQNIAAKRTELTIRKQKLDQEIGSQVKSLEKKLAGFANEERKLDNIERQARKPASGATGKGTALGLTAKALNTYEPFPLEREKAKLLESLR